MQVPDVHEVHVWSGQMSVQPDDAGTGAVVQPKSSKLAHPQLRGYTLPVSKTFGPHDTLAGAVSKNTPTASGHDCREWWAAYSRCSLDSSAVLQAALTRKPANVAADPRGKCLTLRLPQRTSLFVPLCIHNQVSWLQPRITCNIMQVHSLQLSRLVAI